MVLGGWQINGINLFQTGLPFTPTANTSTLNTGTGSRPDRVGSGKIDSPTVDRWFDTAAFRTPGQFMFGNSGRNILSGPGRVNMDFSVFKEFLIVEGEASVPDRVLQRLQSYPVRPAERGDWGGQCRHHHRHRRHSAPDSSLV
jgi:hypothetical protein